MTQIIKTLNVLVTGGTRGIGREISRMIAEKHVCRMFLNYVQNDEEAQRTKTIVEGFNCEAALLKYNISNPDMIDDMFNEVGKYTSKLDILIHCAAINSFKPLTRIKPNQWDLIMNVNARGFLYCVQKCLPLMNKGCIVAISSLGSRKFIPNYGSLSQTKSALESLVRDLGAELAPRGIRVNGITAGIVGMEAVSRFPLSKLVIEDVLRRTPAGRIGSFADITNLVEFLISPKSDWIIGQNIVIDGGYSLT
ncbi:MAG: SDR family oxidoreductase [Ignavibacteria bacterium]|nr:SDR family oxidoreductase [Ignavibacteria bacterium]